MDEQTKEQSVSRLDIVYTFQAYNRRELTFDELIQQTRAWAEAMRRQYARADTPTTPEPAPKATD